MWCSGCGELPSPSPRTQRRILPEPHLSWPGVAIRVIVLAAVYAALGNARGLPEHPLFQGAPGEPIHVAVWMVVPAVAGNIFGMRTGLLVGLLGPLVQYLTPNGTPLDLLNILPHAFMGALAGALARRHASPVPAMAIFSGHLLNVAAFVLAGEWSVGQAVSQETWQQILKEGLIGAIGITVIVSVYQLVVPAASRVADDRSPAGDRSPGEADATEREPPLVEEALDGDAEGSHPRELTTNPMVWKILAAALLAMSVFFAACLYFTNLFLTFLTALLLAVAADRLSTDFQGRYPISGTRFGIRRIYGLTIGGAWAVSLVYLFSRSIEDLADLLETESLSVGLEPLLASLPGWVTRLVATEETIDAVQTYGIGLMSTALSGVSSYIINCFLIVPLALALYFRKRHAIADAIVHTIPTPYRRAVISAAARSYGQLRDFAGAKVVESTLVASICCFGFFVFGVNGWLILGVLAGVSNVIPYLGPLLSAIPPVVVIVASDPNWQLWIWPVIGTVAVAQVVDNMYILPFLISGKVRIEPLASIVLTLVGAKVFGILGMAFAIPIFLLYKIVLVEFYRQLSGYSERTAWE